MDTTKALYEPPEIEKSTSSVIRRSDRIYPSSRAEALKLLRTGIGPGNISVSEAMGRGIISYLQSQGMKNQLPSGPYERVGWINRFHRELAIENPYWPQDIPFWIVYHYFINELKYGEIEVRGANVVTHINAFKNWIRKEGVQEALREANIKYNPDAQKQIPDEITETEEDREIQAQGYVNFTPEVVKEQIKILEMIYGTYEKTLTAFPGYDNYVARLYKTREKMKKEGNYE